MRNMPAFHLALTIVALSLAPFASCAGLPREGWSVGGGGLEKGAEIALSPAADQPWTAKVTSPYLGEGVEVWGEVVLPAFSGGGYPRPDGTDAYELELVEVRYFGNWRKGWTEATFEAAGRLRLSLEDGRWRGAVLEPPSIGAVKSAKLRYMDSFLTGDQALEAVRHRMERIKAAVAVLREDNSSWFDLPFREKRLFRRERGRPFAEKVGPVFFPEVYGYAEGTWGEGPWVKGDGRRWDTAYTQSRFPEHMHEVRDTGTLYRDWEEGLLLWYLCVQWQPFWEEKFPAGEFTMFNHDGDQ